MKSTTICILAIAASLFTLGGGAAQTVPAETPLVDLVSATDAYAAWVVDSCLRTGGFVTVGYGETASVLGEGVPVIFPSAALIPEELLDRTGIPGPGTPGGPEPCCICGIYDPVTQQLRGCAATALPCCCLANLKADGSIVCKCQGGKACASS